MLLWALGFAAGAIIFVVLSEIIPDIQARIGLVTMVLDTTLG